MDASSVLTGAATLKSAATLHKDEVWNSLTESSKNDTETQELLHILFKAFSTTQRLLIDHLPKGKYHSVVDTTIINETASVPTTNVSPERDFAILDRLMHQKPNANAIALEAMILFSRNKTSHWLNKKTEEEKEVIFKAARTLVPATKEKFKARKQAIQKQNEDRLIEKQEDIARKKYKKDQEKEKLAKAIEVIGIWTNRTQVDDGLNKIRNKTEKIKILKLQINFRNIVLNQLPSNNSLFKFFQNKKQFTVEQLKHNLCKLLEQESSRRTPMSCSLEEIVVNPHLLVGQRIRQRFKVEESSELVWYFGTVLKMNPSTYEFQVLYDGEDETYHYPLLDDIKSGDLMLT